VLCAASAVQTARGRTSPVQCAPASRALHDSPVGVPRLPATGASTCSLADAAQRLCIHECALQVLPGLLESVFRPPMGGPGLQIYINAYNSVWLFVFVCVAYAVVRARAGAPSRPVTWHLCIARAPHAAQGACCEQPHGCASAQGSCLTGNTARLPLIADAADQQVR